MKRKILFFSLMLTFLFASCSNLIDELTVTKEKETNYTVTYTVTFNSNGGSDVESQTVASGSKATEPAVPSKNGFVFIGWYSDTSLESAFNFDTAITANITLYAKWTPSGIYTESSAYYINVDSQSSPSDGNGAW